MKDEVAERSEVLAHKPDLELAHVGAVQVVVELEALGRCAGVILTRAQQCALTGASSSRLNVVVLSCRVNRVEVCFGLSWMRQNGSVVQFLMIHEFI